MFLLAHAPWVVLVVVLVEMELLLEGVVGECVVVAAAVQLVIHGCLVGRFALQGQKVGQTPKPERSLRLECWRSRSL